MFKLEALFLFFSITLMGLRLASVAVMAAVLLTVGVACDSSGGTSGDGLQAFTIEIANIGSSYPVLKSGAIERPINSNLARPALPGEGFEFTITAPPNTVPGEEMRLNVALMFVESNDLFYSFGPEGIPLYNADGTPRGMNGQEDVTSEIVLFDAGTEPNEEPAAGTTQPGDPGDDDTNVGPTEGGTIQIIPDGGTDIAGFSYPEAVTVLRATVAYVAENEFLIRILNESDPSQSNPNGCTLTPPPDGCRPVTLSPVVWAVHNASYSFFEVGQPATEGIERLAEDGEPLPWAEELEPETGVTALISPGAFAVHSNTFTFFTLGNAASEGIERLAEDGDPAILAAAFASDENVKASETFLRGTTASVDGPIGPGETFSFTIEAERGDRLTLAMMYVQSNDLFYGMEPEGLSLFTREEPLAGDITVRLRFFDAGTEGDEEPGVGAFQPIRQPEPNTGPEGEGVITRIGSRDDGFTYPDIPSLLRVTITPDVAP
ncbi:MAG: hypothetical protein HKN04_02825 [Rhodothermaceae bacterium]|nr:hypothetical protein [Rhodothermaceae bacterium]